MIKSIPCLRQKSRKTYPGWTHVPIKPLQGSTSPEIGANLVHIQLKISKCPKNAFPAKSSDNQGSGSDPGFFLGGGASLRNDVTEGEVKKF